MKRIRRELRMCAMLDHDNILPVYGHSSSFGPYAAFVSPWAANGDLTAYLEREYTWLPIVKKFGILRDVIAGLQYLHGKNGDLTGNNVLIYLDGTACLTDLDLSLMDSEGEGTSQAAWTSSFRGSVRWMAPELFGEREDGLPVRPSKESDIYSFAGIFLQVLTNRIPYWYHPRDAIVIRDLITSVKPIRSRYDPIPDKYWQFIEECWSIEICHRPSTGRVVEVVSDELDLLRIAFPELLLLHTSWPRRIRSLL